MNLKELVRIAILEDLPEGDVTTSSLALKPKYGLAKLRAKEDLILSGSLAFELTMMNLDPSCRIQWHFEDGDKILNQQIICTIEGDLLQILKAERVALNFLGRLSGIATHTQRFVKRIEGLKTKILDTRKTTPGYRDLEKKAVVHGGGMNHRMNLSHAILIKDNHITVMGGVKNAVERVLQHTQLPIEVEVKNLEEIKECIELPVQRLLLDNMSNDEIANALKIIPAEMQTEASGNMNLDRIRSVAELGVDFISVGALTHSAPVADVSLLFDWRTP